MTYYKVLNADGTPCNGGSGTWNLPHGKRPGKWMPEIANIIPCSRGYHLCEPKHLIHWLGPTIWEAEGHGHAIAQDGKIVFAQARLLRRVTTWNDRTARLFACDCADRVMPIYAKRYPGEDRPQQCIATARRFANGEATAEELAAARDAARAAAWDADWDAAWAARDAARAAAWAAAWAAWAAAWAAWDAAWDAARDAARDWQTNRLFEYLHGTII